MKREASSRMLLESALAAVELLERCVTACLYLETFTSGRRTF